VFYFGGYFLTSINILAFHKRFSQADYCPGCLGVLCLGEPPDRVDEKLDVNSISTQMLLFFFSQFAVTPMRLALSGRKSGFSKRKTTSSKCSWMTTGDDRQSWMLRLMSLTASLM